MLANRHFVSSCQIMHGPRTIRRGSYDQRIVPTGIELSDGLNFGELIVGLGTLTLAGFTAWLT